ncbi:hypothetical protein PAXRUDRAFT_21192 [Paxillus rubicundulus Ve08.2h10]|uniref:Uncharacterized protein n=1 Tax=Paxillus rubicundulus Ve08.2h10 TaxID=930991 RepID=A0A0D0D022_9AGAM|nr:hypothetical protein PAXRUDRAFT_21192 [Paxillus rubicundulus Ve08.2h10]
MSQIIGSASSRPSRRSKEQALKNQVWLTDKPSGRKRAPSSTVPMEANAPKVKQLRTCQDLQNGGKALQVAGDQDRQTLKAGNFGSTPGSMKKRDRCSQGAPEFDNPGNESDAGSEFHDKSEEDNESCGDRRSEPDDDLLQNAQHADQLKASLQQEVPQIVNARGGTTTGWKTKWSQYPLGRDHSTRNKTQKSGTNSTRSALSQPLKSSWVPPDPSDSELDDIQVLSESSTMAMDLPSCNRQVPVAVPSSKSDVKQNKMGRRAEARAREIPQWDTTNLQLTDDATSCNEVTTGTGTGRSREEDWPVQTRLVVKTDGTINLMSQQPNIADLLRESINYEGKT